MDHAPPPSPNEEDFFHTKVKQQKYQHKFKTTQNKKKGMVLNATLSNISAISWRSVLMVEETGVPGENHRPVASQWQPLAHHVVSSTPRHKRN